MTTEFGSAGSILTEKPPNSTRYVPTPRQHAAPDRAATDSTTASAPAAPAPSAYTSAPTAPLLARDESGVPLISGPVRTAAAPPPPTMSPVAALVGPNVRSIDDFEVVYDDAAGRPMIAFADGQWYDVTGPAPRPISVRNALRRDSAWAGAVVQTVCLWMRSNPRHERSFDLATELALAVGELARQHR